MLRSIPGPLKSSSGRQPWHAVLPEEKGSAMMTSSSTTHLMAFKLDPIIVDTAEVKPERFCFVTASF
jgi:hypothetical protein